MSSVFSQLHENLQEALAVARQWQPTPIQESAIPDVIDGKDRLLIAPTGSVRHYPQSYQSYTDV